MSRPKIGSVTERGRGERHPVLPQQDLLPVRGERDRDAQRDQDREPGQHPAGQRREVRDVAAIEDEDRARSVVATTRLAPPTDRSALGRGIGEAFGPAPQRTRTDGHPGDQATGEPQVAQEEHARDDQPDEEQLELRAEPGEEHAVEPDAAIPDRVGPQVEERARQEQDHEDGHADDRDRVAPHEAANAGLSGTPATPATSGPGVPGAAASPPGPPGAPGPPPERPAPRSSRATRPARGWSSSGIGPRRPAGSSGSGSGSASGSSPIACRRRRSSSRMNSSNASPITRTLRGNGRTPLRQRRSRPRQAFHGAAEGAEHLVGQLVAAHRGSACRLEPERRADRQRAAPRTGRVVGRDDGREADRRDARPPRG